MMKGAKNQKKGFGGSMPFHSWFSKMTGMMNGAKERMNDSKKKGPDPFFTEW